MIIEMIIDTSTSPCDSKPMNDSEETRKSCSWKSVRIQFVAVKFSTSRWRKRKRKQNKWLCRQYICCYSTLSKIHWQRRTPWIGFWINKKSYAPDEERKSFPLVFRIRRILLTQDMMISIILLFSTISYEILFNSYEVTSSSGTNSSTNSQAWAPTPNHYLLIRTTQEMWNDFPPKK